MCGFPYSGKSLFSKEVAAKTSIVRISFDDTWNMLIEKIPELTYEMTIAYMEKQIVACLENKKSVIYDSTSLTAEDRMKLIYLAEKAGAKGVVIHIVTTKEETLRRREQSRIDHSHHVVDQENIDKAFEYFEAPADGIILKSEDDKQKLLAELSDWFPIVSHG